MPIINLNYPVKTVEPKLLWEHEHVALMKVHKELAEELTHFQAVAKEKEQLVQQWEKSYWELTESLKQANKKVAELTQENEAFQPQESDNAPYPPPSLTIISPPIINRQPCRTELIWTVDSRCEEDPDFRGVEIQILKNEVWEDVVRTTSSGFVDLHPEGKISRYRLRCIGTKRESEWVEAIEAMTGESTTAPLASEIPDLSAFNEEFAPAEEPHPDAVKWQQVYPELVKFIKTLNTEMQHAKEENQALRADAFNTLTLADFIRGVLRLVREQ